MMQQVRDNPDLMRNMMQSPYMQDMMQNMTNDPSLASQILSQNPMFANNPQMQGMLPQMLEQMRNPETLNAFSNPRAMEAMLQVQQGLQTLRQEAPGMFPDGLLPDGGTMPNRTTTTNTNNT